MGAKPTCSGCGMRFARPQALAAHRRTRACETVRHEREMAHLGYERVGTPALAYLVKQYKIPAVRGPYFLTTLATDRLVPRLSPDEFAAHPVRRRVRDATWVSALVVAAFAFASREEFLAAADEGLEALERLGAMHLLAGDDEVRDLEF